MSRDWESIDFSPGKVTWIGEGMQEDMLQVEFPSNFILDMGWYAVFYKAYIIRDCNWDDPVYSVTTEDESELCGILLDCRDRIIELVEN